MLRVVLPGVASKPGMGLAKRVFGGAGFACNLVGEILEVELRCAIRVSDDHDHCFLDCLDRGRLQT